MLAAKALHPGLFVMRSKAQFSPIPQKAKGASKSAALLNVSFWET